MPRHPERRRGQTSATLRQGVIYSLIAIIAGFATTRWLEKRQAERLVGRLHAHEVLVRAPVTGRLNALMAEPGRVVDCGAPLARFEDARDLEHRNEIRKRIAGLEQELALALAQSDIDLAWRLKTIETERHELQIRQASLLQQKFDQELRQQSLEERLGGPKASATESVPRISPTAFDSEASEFKSLEPRDIGRDARSGETTIALRLEREATVNAIEVAAAQLSLCERRLEQLKQLSDQLPAQVKRAAGVESLEARLNAARAEAAALPEKPAAVELKAPDYGTVGIWKVRSGDPVRADEPLVTLFDEDRRFILVPVSSEQVELFQEGTRVRLTFPGSVRRKGIVAPLPRQTNWASAEETPGLNDRVGMLMLRIEATDRPWPASPIGTVVGVRVDR